MNGTDLSARFQPAEQQAVLQALLSLLRREGVGVTIKDAGSGQYLMASESMSRVLGRPPEQLVGHADGELLEPAVAMVLRAADHAALAAEAPSAQDHRFDAQGQRHDYTVARLSTPGGAEHRRLLCALWLDQAAHRQREAQLKQALEQLELQQRANDALRRELSDQALRDITTGLYKRSHFEDQLRREVDLSNREHREFALVLMRIDNPLACAGALGEVGVARLQEALGRLIRSSTRAMDVSSRLEDNLFGVLLSGVGLATAHSRMEGLRRQCAQQIVLHAGQELRFSVAAGVASYPHTAQTITEVQAACLQALEQAQERGGNRLVMASISLELAQAG